MIKSTVFLIFLIFVFVRLNFSTCDEKSEDESNRKSGKESNEDIVEIVKSVTSKVDLETLKNSFENRGILGMAVPRTCGNDNEQYDSKSRMCRTKSFWKFKQLLKLSCNCNEICNKKHAFSVLSAILR